MWGRRKLDLLGSFGWSVNKVNMRQINGGKEPNLTTGIRTGAPHT